MSAGIVIANPFYIKKFCYSFFDWKVFLCRYTVFVQTSTLLALFTVSTVNDQPLVLSYLQHTSITPMCISSYVKSARTLPV